jgi:Ser/Thr protein kinase RdoA (MazF antagonist)
MPDLEFFKRLVLTNYDTSIQAIVPFAASFIGDMRAVLQLQLTDGTSWVLRAYHQDFPIPDWLVGCAADTPSTWRESRAATLHYLAEQHYLAPSVIVTRAGARIGAADGWCTLMTTFIDGHVTDPTPATLSGMAAALGRLHQLQLANPTHMATTTGKSWWYPTIAIPAALQRYASVADDLPPVWRPTVESFCATLRAIDRQRMTLPHALIHGDAWAGNAVQTPSGHMVFIDWEPSGQGIAILDLGRLLLHCHQDLAAPLTTPIEPSRWHVNAVIEGYCAARIPTASERAMLLDAIRFGVAFGAATHFKRAQRDNWKETQPERLTRRQQWYTVSAVIADFAEQRFEQLL